MASLAVARRCPAAGTLGAALGAELARATTSDVDAAGPALDAVLAIGAHDNAELLELLAQSALQIGVGGTRRGMPLCTDTRHSCE